MRMELNQQMLDMIVHQGILLEASLNQFSLRTPLKHVQYMNGTACLGLVCNSSLTYESYPSLLLLVHSLGIIHLINYET